jgi:threonine dehydrogenase-like Zn-dependent dehydrogenase
LQVFGSWSSEPRHLKSAIDFLVRDGVRFPFETLVTHRFGLGDAQRALETTAAWQCGKCVLVPGTS